MLMLLKGEGLIVKVVLVSGVLAEQFDLSLNFKMGSSCWTIQINGTFLSLAAIRGDHLI